MAYPTCEVVVVFCFLQNTSCIRKLQVLSGGGGGGPLAIANLGAVVVKVHFCNRSQH